MSPALRRECARVMRHDLRRIKARIDGLGRDVGRDAFDRKRLLLDLEMAAHYTRQSLAVVEAR